MSFSKRQTTSPVTFTVFIKLFMMHRKLTSFSRTNQIAHSSSFFRYIIVIRSPYIFPIFSILYIEKNLSTKYLSSRKSSPTKTIFFFDPI